MTRTLRQRVSIAFITVTAAVCVLFGTLSFIFVYVVEDEFFAALLANEEAHIRGGGTAPRLPFVTYYRSWEEVPAEVRAAASPRAREVAGSGGRHYHLRHIALAGKDAWLVAEVSSLLVVRPMRSTLLTILIPATAIVLLGSSVVAAIVARRSVAQLTALVDAVEHDRLSSVNVTDHEVRVLARALEDALARVHTLLEREKAFVGDVSHELRTPVAVIRGAAELLERRSLDETASAQVRRIRDAARSSEEIIALLLALAREETAREEPSSIPLLPLIDTLVLRHRELLGREDAAVRIDVQPRARIVAPRTAAEVVIANLIANALRHGGGSIEITARDAEIAVSDCGPGLDAGAGGRGIGLHLVRRLCDVCGFALTIDSSAKGTTARVAFPGS